MKRKKIFSPLFKKWFWTIVAMIVLSAISVLINGWLADKVWIVFLLDILFFLCLWLTLREVKYFNQRRLSYEKGIWYAILVFFITLSLVSLATITLALFDHLWVRLNVLLFGGGMICIIKVMFPASNGRLPYGLTDVNR